MYVLGCHLLNNVNRLIEFKILKFLVYLCCLAKLEMQFDVNLIDQIFMCSSCTTFLRNNLWFKCNFLNVTDGTKLYPSVSTAIFNSQQRVTLTISMKVLSEHFYEALELANISTWMKHWHDVNWNLNAASFVAKSCHK